MQRIESIGITNLHRNYFNIIYQATRYYPGFDNLISRIFENELSLWRQIVKNASDNKEIQQQLNIEEVAMRFRYIYSGLSFECSLKQGLDTILLKQLYDKYYEEIKL